jgi:hypothetical protein
MKVNYRNDNNNIVWSLQAKRYESVLKNEYYIIKNKEGVMYCESHISPASMITITT